MLRYVLQQKLSLFLLRISATAKQKIKHPLLFIDCADCADSSTIFLVLSRNIAGLLQTTRAKPA
jgi:hypothetical protein